MAKNFADVLSDVAARSQFVVLGDTDHGDTGLLGFVGKREHMQALAKQGVKHFFFERNEISSDILQGYQDGTRSRAELEQNLTINVPHAVGGAVVKPLLPDQQKDMVLQMMQTIDAARESGIRVHFVYNDAGNQELLNLGDAFNTFGQKMIERAVRDTYERDPERTKDVMAAQQRLIAGGTAAADFAKTEEFLGQWVTSRPREEAAAMHAEYVALTEPRQRELGKARIDADGDVAARMRAIAGTSKAAVFYGASHGMHADDLDNFLPNSARVLIARGANFLDVLRPMQDELIDRTRAVDSKQAEGIYLVNEGRYVRNNTAEINAACAAAGVEMSALTLCGLEGTKMAEPKAEPAEPKVHAKQNTKSGINPNT